MSHAAGWVTDFGCDLVFAALALVLLAFLQWLECRMCHARGKRAGAFHRLIDLPFHLPFHLPLRPRRVERVYAGTLTQEQLDELLASTTCAEACVPFSSTETLKASCKKARGGPELHLAASLTLAVHAVTDLPPTCHRSATDLSPTSLQPSIGRPLWPSIGLR